jgi:hypothetical protein
VSRAGKCWQKKIGTYEPIDFLAVLFGHAIGGERTLVGFFERVEHARVSLDGALWMPMFSSSRHVESLAFPMSIVRAREAFRAPGYTRLMSTPVPT